ncbi:hypothetical protein [Planobispora rosea]|uniref:hypothetical protein n=1 Tax=Planobispora rosea TaxID=35762 RepID=UPI00159F2CD7|nr:hypothetical protein [Planobispora rosea]
MGDSPLDRLNQHNPDLASRLRTLSCQGEQAAQQVLAGDYILRWRPPRPTPP